MYQKALDYSYEFNFEKAYLKHIFTSIYAPRMIKSKISTDKINEVMNLFCSSCTLEYLDENYLRPDILKSICTATSLTPSVLYDDYYSFIFSDYSTRILQWRKKKKISQKKAAKFLKVSPVDLSNWERGISYPSRLQFTKLQEVIN